MSNNSGSDTPTLTSAQVAQARSYTYSLLARVYLEGVTPALRPYLQAIPELAAILPQPFDPDEAAADHQHLFGFNLLPYETIFLDAAGLLGGTITEAVTQQYRENGFMAPASVAADHVGCELALLAFLCAAEAEAQANNRQKTAVQWQQQQYTFLHTHLLRWLFSLVTAVSRQLHPFYAQLAHLTAVFVSDHAAALSDGKSAPDFALPEPPPLLSDEATGLKQIAHYLMTPPHSGVFLSRDDISRLARRLALPRGFGDRGQILHNLLQTAVQHDALPQLLLELIETWQQWQASYRKTSQNPALEPFLRPWQDRCAATIRVLHTIQEQTAYKIG